MFTVIMKMLKFVELLVKIETLSVIIHPLWHIHVTSGIREHLSFVPTFLLRLNLAFISVSVTSSYNT